MLCTNILKEKVNTMHPEEISKQKPTESFRIVFYTMENISERGN